MTKPHNAYCSFCRNGFQDVGPLVEGPGNVYICADCIELCQSILVQEKLRRQDSTSRLPLTLAEQYRPATDQEVRSWSFGEVKAMRFLAATNWEQQRGTLDDQRIFGPRTAFRCVCGKYQEAKYQNMICDYCGVKVTLPDVRHQRFGHMEMPLSIEHPLGEKGEQLSTIPVLPATFFESSGGKALAEVYEELILAVYGGSAEKIRFGWNRLVDLLVPVLTFAQKWDLQEAKVIARGLALELRATEADL